MTEVDEELVMEELLKKFEVEDQQKLEVEFGVEIEAEAVLHACDIIKKYPDVWQIDCRGTFDDTQKTILQIKVVEFLEEACHRLRQKFDYSREGEDELEVGEYRLHRALVELNEMEREREPSSQKWRDRVAKELEELKDAWNKLEIKLLQLQASRQRYDIRAREALLLERMREGLVLYLNEGRIKSDYSGMLKWIEEHVNELLYTTRHDFKQELTVSSQAVALAASMLIDAPLSRLVSESPLLQNLEPIKRVIGQEHVLLAVSAALSRQRRRRCPIGSFIFMCGSGCGRTEIAKLLATLVFGKKDLLTEVDLEKYTGPTSVTRLLGVLSSHMEPGKKGGQGVKKRHLGVILFDNVDKASIDIINLLTQIIGYGHLVDHGNTIDFNNTLIIMTTNVGSDQLWPWDCKCADEVQKFPVKDGLYDDEWERNHNSCYLSLLRETKNHFNPVFLEFVDDVIGFRSLSPQQLKAVARLQLRDLAICMTQKGLIIYSSEAALDIIVRRSAMLGDRIKGGEKIRMWLEQNLVPMLFEMISKNEISDLSIMYIEASLETDQLSFRMEKSGRLLEERDANQLAFLKELRLMFIKEKERARRIYLLRRYQNKLRDNSNAAFEHITNAVQDMINLIQDLITIPSSIIKSSLENPKKVALAALDEDERQNKRAKKGTKE